MLVAKPHSVVLLRPLLATTGPVVTSAIENIQTVTNPLFVQIYSDYCETDVL